LTYKETCDKIYVGMHIFAYLVWEGNMQDFIKVTKALSDETRLRILNVLLLRDCCVCEIMQALDISQSRASRNLGILQDASFLKERRDGPWIVYSVNWETANYYASSLTKLLRDSPLSNEILVKDKERLKHAQRTGPGCGLSSSSKNR